MVAHMKIKFILPALVILILLAVIIADWVSPSKPVTRLIDSPINTVLRFHAAVALAYQNATDFHLKRPPAFS